MTLNNDLQIPMQPSGYTMGVDEAGRGAWAGPLVVCACAVPVGWGFDWVKDSKEYAEEARREAYEMLRDADDIWYNVRYVSARDIDEIGVDAAHVEAMRAAIESLFYMLNPTHPGYPDRLIVDGVWPDFFSGAEYIAHADKNFASVSAASIIAKQAHDDYMLHLHSLSQYNAYGFDSHKGYGTKEHKSALRMHGVTTAHRLSFQPIKEMARTQGFTRETFEGDARVYLISTSREPAGVRPRRKRMKG